MNNRTRNTIVLICLVIVLLSQIVQLNRCYKIVTTIQPIDTPWIKQDVLIEMKPSGITIWVDDAETDRLIVDSVEGVVNTSTYGDGYQIYVRVDPRYNKELVAKDILRRLTRVEKVH